MKNIGKRGLAILLIFAMLLSLPSLIISVSAASGETMDLYVDTVTAMPENTVQITVELKNNPGLASLKFNVVYDSYLTLENLTFDQAFGAYVLAPTPYKNPQTLSFISPLEEVNANGTFATLTFRVSANAPDNYMAKITVDCDAENVFDGDLAPVGVNIHNGAINIIHGIPGDIDGDRKVNNKDAIMLFRYVAGWNVTADEAALDVNCDGSVNNKDAITLFRYVAGWDVEIGRGPSSAACEHRKAEKIPAVLPTCTEDGYSEGEKCADCGEVINEPVKLPAVGHGYENGVCTRCGDEDENYNPDASVEGSQGLEYRSNGDGTCTVVGIGSCTDVDLVIPEYSPEGDRVTEIGEEAFLSCSNLKSIEIPDSVTTIGKDAFCECTGLTSMVIPNNVTLVGAGVLARCTNLVTVKIPNRLNKLSKDMFNGCSSLTSVVIPDSVTIIGGNAFMDCSSLSSIMIPDGVVEIGSGAFACTALSSIDIPDNVVILGDDVFNGCSYLTSIVLPDGVTRIGSHAFYYCCDLASIVIPAGVTEIDFAAFLGCSSLNDVYFSGTRVEWNSIRVEVFNDCLDSAIVHFDNDNVESNDPPMWDDRYDIVTHLSFDQLYLGTGEANSEDENNIFFYPGDSATWNHIAQMNPSQADTLTYWGWIGIMGEVGSFGYQINNDIPIYSDAWTHETEARVYDIAIMVTGADTASRMKIAISIADLAGENTIRVLYKNPDGVEVCLTEFVLIISEEIEIPDNTPKYKKIVLGAQLSNSGSFDPFCWNKTRFGQRFKINEDVLSQIFIANLATYADGNINTWSLKVWQWNGNYESTVAEEPLFLLLGENHVDNTPFLTDIPIELGIKGDIYYELEYLSGSKFFTSWEADPVEGVEVYLEGERTRTNYKAYASVVPADTGEPDDPDYPDEPENPQQPATDYDVPMDTWTVSGHCAQIVHKEGHGNSPMVAAGGIESGALLHQGAVGIGEIDLSKYSKAIISYGIDNSPVTVGHYEANANNRIMLSKVDNHMSNVPAEEDIIASATYTLEGWSLVTIEIDLTEVDYNGPVFVTYDTLPGTFMLIGKIEFVPAPATDYDVPMDTWTVSGYASGLTSKDKEGIGPMVGAGGLEVGALLHRGAVGVGEIDLSKYSHVVVYCGCDNSYVTQEHYANSLNNRIILSKVDTHMTYSPAEEDIIAATTYTLHGWIPEAVIIDLTDVDYNGPVYFTYDTLPDTFMLVGSIEFITTETIDPS
ncbi:MAG: leucine-rich repeat protein [Clostridia bacterium]|nr:leucine-rich repeat protein [Clostridia bacterium]